MANIEKADRSEWFDAEVIRNKPTFFGGAVLFMVCFIAIFANIALGGVNTGVLALITLLIGLLVIFWFLDAWKTRKFNVSTNVLQLPIIGLILIGVIQLLPLSSPDVPANLLSVSPVSSLSLDPYSTRFAILKLIMFLIFFNAALTFINSQKRLRKVVFTIVIFSAIMAFLGILQRLASPQFIYGIREVKQAIPFGSFVNQHHFAAFMEMTIGLACGLFLGRATKKDKFLLLIMSILLMGISILFTGSRGGLLSLLGVIGFLVIMNVIYRKKNVKDAEDENRQTPNQFISIRNLELIIGGVLLVVVLFFSVIWLGGGDSVLRSTGIQTNQDDYTSGRIHFWGVTLRIIQENPILGTGLESFGVAFTKYDTWNGQFRVEHAHNDYLQILSDAGILGFLCVLAFIFLLFKQSLHIIRTTSDSFRRNVAIGALAGCFGILIHSIFDFPLRTNANMFFFLIFVSISVVSINYPKLYRTKVKMESPQLEGNQDALEGKQVKQLKEAKSSEEE